MNSSEFKEWFAYHTARFTGIAAWLAKFPATGNEHVPGRADVLAAWSETLVTVPLAAAKEASRKLASGEAEQPRSFDTHPQAVRRLASEAAGNTGNPYIPASGERGKLINGDLCFRCLDCEDYGAVSVWGKSLMEMAAEASSWPPAQFPRNRVYSGLIACRCDLGASWLRREGAGATYDPEQHISTLLCRSWRSEQFWQMSRERMDGERQMNRRLDHYGLT